MASSAPHTIVLRSNNPDNMMQRVHENPAQAAITPGDAIEYGTTNTVKVHATSGGASLGRKVAIENPWSDHGTIYGSEGPNIDHAYAAGETVFWVPANPGDVFYMWLAASQNVAKEAPLTSNGAGKMTALTVDASALTDALWGYADEAVDNSGGGSPVRIRVRAA